MAHAEDLLRTLAPQVLAAVYRRFGDFATAEDAVQEALFAAAVEWPERGVPDNPRAWLIRVAARRMADQLRADLARRRREAAVAIEEPTAGSSEPERDDTLHLVFMCCHSALTPSSQIALTLRAIGGLTTAEIAAAFLVPEATMAQRISRAKERITSSPDDKDWAGRLSAVLHVLYLIFNEGYAATSGENLQRPDLAREAIRLTRGLRDQLSDSAEVAGLLALMLLTDARRHARTGPHGELIPLAEQDRAQWDRNAIAEGVALISETLAKGEIGMYQLQAAIAAVHDEAPRAADTDWPQIRALYGLLRRMSDNPMVELNYAVAVAMVDGPAAGLELLERLDGLHGHYRLDAVKAHFLEMAGRRQEAIEHYRRAAAGTTSVPERNYLLMKMSGGGAPERR
jgi:RNA polymerase sigma factor (sigma-70 family)